jgi:hypothetical protein
MAVGVAGDMGEHVPHCPAREQAGPPHVIVGDRIDHPEEACVGLSYAGDVAFGNWHSLRR